VSGTDPLIVGRDPELARLDAFLAAADAGAAALVIEGDAGAGKTTLWTEAVRRARAKGDRVLSCSPSEPESKLSFQGLADLLGPVLPEVLGGLAPIQRRALEAALLLSEPEAEPADQRTVAAGTLAVLRAVVAGGPVLIAIDDVQWLDPASEAALVVAARRLGELPVSALLATRPRAGSEPRPLETAFEHRLGPVDRLTVGRLSDGALHDLIRQRLGLVLPRPLLERIGRTSGGNPFFAIEFATALSQRSEAPEAGVALPVPETLRGLLRQRLDALAPAVQDVAAAVAALSEPSFATLAAFGAEEGAIDAAVRAGILEVEGHGVRFTHPLLASGAYDRLGPQARHALHRRLAIIVDGEERVRHLAMGEGGPSSTVAAELHLAARRAAARGAIAAAAELAEQAVRLTPAVEAAEIAERRLEAAGYEVRAGDTDRARAHLEPLLRDLSPGPTRARVMLRLARLQEAGPVRALEMCREVVEEAGPDDLALVAEAHQLAAEMSMLSGDVPGAIEHARVAAGRAEDAGDPSILVECLGTLCHYETYTGAITPGLLERAVELERRQPRPSNNYSPREILGLRLMYADRLEEARGPLEQSYATAEELGDELDRASLLIHLTQLECRAGRLAEAVRDAREAEVSIEQAGAPRTAGRFASALALAHIGRVSEARSAGEEGVALASEGGSRMFQALNRWALGFLELSLGDAPAAHRRMDGLSEEFEAMGYWNPGVRPVYADAIEARIGAGEVDADPLIDELELRGRALDNPWVLAVSARCRGLLLAARGDLEGAIAELERALAEHERSPQPLERGRTLLRLGSAYRRAKRRGDARQTLTEALEVFDELGAPLWAERAAAELARVPGRGPAAAGLTEAERRVAELVTEGLSNREIASRLFVTVRTVEANLTRAYAKLGVRSRTELVRRLSSQDGS
jgi:DNA-binding CsgD family transcriptional regulator